MGTASLRDSARHRGGQLLLLLWVAWLMPVAAEDQPQRVEVSPELGQRLIEFRRDLHQHPELANRETRTTERVAGYLTAAGYSAVQMRVAKTGVVATLRGGRPGPTLAIRAPLDAFPIQDTKQTAYRSQVPNVSHACGHDAMVAMALGAATLLVDRREQLVGEVRFIFQPAEEGAPADEEGGAQLMVKEGALDSVAMILAFHVEPELPVGEVGLHLGAVYAGADTFAVTVQGKSAHGATPWKGVDAITVSNQIIQGLQLLVSREVDPADPAILTIGTIHGGVRSNAIADEVTFEGTLRTYTPERRQLVRARMDELSNHMAAAFQAKAEVTFRDETPPTMNDAALATRFQPLLASLVGGDRVRVLRPMPYADDFSFMAERVPAFYFQVGTRNAITGIIAGTHTGDFDLDEQAIPLGARLLAELVLYVLQ